VVPPLPLSRFSASLTSSVLRPSTNLFKPPPKRRSSALLPLSCCSGDVNVRPDFSSFGGATLYACDADRSGRSRTRKEEPPAGGLVSVGLMSGALPELLRLKSLRLGISAVLLADRVLS
jgi:hypothetical protein